MKKATDNIKRHKKDTFPVNHLFFPKVVRLRDKYEKYGSARQAIDART
jgi:hypothetical protein